MARVFFKATEDALNNITEQFKLVHHFPEQRSRGPLVDVSPPLDALS